MNVYKKVLKVKTGDAVSLYFLGDVHEGNINHAGSEFATAVKMIQDDPTARWIGMGDYIDAIVADDKKRFTPQTLDQSYSIADLKDLPYKQMERFFTKIKPIQDKCIGLGVGNHEQSVVKYKYNDIMERLIDMFDDPPPNLGYVWYYRLGISTRKSAKASYYINIAGNHGVGGNGKTPGYPINKINEVFENIICDVGVMGHIHRLKTDDRRSLSVSSGMKLKHEKKIFGITGCFLKTYVDGNENYFESRGRQESEIGMLKLNIKVNHDSPRLSWHVIKL